MNSGRLLGKVTCPERRLFVQVESHPLEISNTSAFFVTKPRTKLPELKKRTAQLSLARNWQHQMEPPPRHVRTPIQAPGVRGKYTTMRKGGGMNADIRLALRQLRKAPGFTLTAVFTLALAIGANAIVFSVLNALILRPLNVPYPETLFMLERAYGSDTTPSESYPDYRDLRDRNRSFDSLVLYNIMGGVGLDTGHGNPSVVWPYTVSGNYFDALGIQPYLGRFIHASEEHGQNSVPEIVLSYALWHSQFNGDPAAVGRTVQINKHPYTIIGVAPPDFRGTELFFAPDLWAPIVDSPQITDWFSLEERGNHNAWAIGHLKPGVTPAAATSDLNTIANSLAKTYPKSDDGLKFSLSRPGLAGNTLGRPTRAFLLGLTLLAGLILLAACANLGSLFAARAADRSREIAVRMALGSRRQLIFRQLITEGILVSLAGGICGTAAAVVILRILSTWRPIPNIPINIPVNPDMNTYALAFFLAVFSGLFFGRSLSARFFAPIPGRSFAPEPQASGAHADLPSATFCWVCRSPFALSWSPLRWSPCAAWLVRCKATTVSSLRTLCS